MPLNGRWKRPGTGVTRIVPLAAARSEKALLVAAPKRAERWTKILWKPRSNRARVSVPCLSHWPNRKLPFAWKAEALRVFLSGSAGGKPLRVVLAGQQQRAAVLGRLAGAVTDASLPPGAARSFRRLRSASSSSVPRPPSSRRLLSLNFALSQTEVRPIRSLATKVLWRNGRMRGVAPTALLILVAP